MDKYYNKKYSNSLKEKNNCENIDIFNFFKEISINENIYFKTDEVKKERKIFKGVFIFLEEKQKK